MNLKAIFDNRFNYSLYTCLYSTSELILSSKLKMKMKIYFTLTLAKPTSCID